MSRQLMIPAADTRLYAVDDRGGTPPLLFLSHPILVGWSYGATIAVRYAAQHPGRVAGLVLIDGAWAATYGAVDTVIVDIDEKVPGFVDDASGAVTFSEEDDAVSYGVVDEIVRRVLLSGGRVFAVRAPDVPGGGPVAAILRYAL